MIYCRTKNEEVIYFHPYEDMDVTYYIKLTKESDIFSVTCSFIGGWEWDFIYTVKNYEVVKYIIMDIMMGAEKVTDLIDALDDLFYTECQEMLFDEDDCFEEDVEDCSGFDKYTMKYDPKYNFNNEPKYKSPRSYEDYYFECDGNCAKCEFNKDNI